MSEEELIIIYDCLERSALRNLLKTLVKYGCQYTYEIESWRDVLSNTFYYKFIYLVPIHVEDEKIERDVFVSVYNIISPPLQDMGKIHVIKGILRSKILEEKHVISRPNVLKYLCDKYKINLFEEMKNE